MNKNSRSNLCASPRGYPFVSLPSGVLWLGHFMMFSWRRGWKAWLILRWRKVFGELLTPAFASNRQPPFSCSHHLCCEHNISTCIHLSKRTLFSYQSCLVDGIQCQVCLLQYPQCIVDPSTGGSIVPQD